METSLKVFCGDYITDKDAKEISDKYWQITQALELVNFPFAFPGTKVWSACRAREVTVKYLSKAAAASKKAVAAGKEPDCLLDEWVEEIHAGKVRKYDDKEMALVLLSFIFASQGEQLFRLVSEQPLMRRAFPQMPCPPRSPSLSNSSPTTPKFSPRFEKNKPPSVTEITKLPCLSPSSSKCPTPTQLRKKFSDTALPSSWFLT